MSGERGLATLLRSARGHALWKTLGVYLVTSWVALQVVDFLAQNFGMPDWFPAAAVGLLVIGLPIVLATAIVQGGPAPAGAAGEGAEPTGPAVAGLEPGSAVPSAGPAAPPSSAQRLFTWRNAVLGGMAAFALWGVVATVWIVAGDPRGTRALGTDDDGDNDLRTVAVLPFDNLSTDAENAFFADGIHEDVLTHLSKIEDLTVISRTSVLAYRETTQNLSTIGLELGAGAIVEGSVRRSGDNVRITAQLIDARTDEHLWADNFDRALTAANVFAIQTEIAQRIAAALATTLTPEVESRMARAPTANLEAYDFVLRGREAYRRYEEDANNEALGRFRAALERDPNYAEAWAGIADAYGQRVFRFGYGMEWADSAEIAANRAVELSPTLPSALKSLALAHSARGFVQRSIETNIRALELDPNYSDAMNNLAVDYGSMGRLAEAHRWYQRAFRLQPNIAFARANFAGSYSALGEFELAVARLNEAIELDPQDVTPRSYLTGILIVAGDQEGALAVADGLVRDYPDMTYALNWAAGTLLFAGEWERAQDAASRSMALSPDQDLGTWHHARDVLALATKRLGDATEADGHLRESATLWELDLERTRELPAIPYQLAAVHAALGEDETALRWLRQAYDGGFKGYRRTALAPFFEDLRDHPEFRSIIESMKADVERMRLEIEREETAAGER